MIFNDITDGEPSVYEFVLYSVSFHSIFCVTFFLLLLFVCRTLFIVAILPNIMNGFHLNSYVFVGKMPDQYWCDVPVLQQNGWSADRIRELSAV